MNAHHNTHECHRCFLPSFGSIGQVVSEEMIFRNWPTRIKNCLSLPCLFTDHDEMSNLCIGPSIDASYQFSVHLANGFQRRWSLMFVCLMVFNATFNNISVISWRSVLLVEETGRKPPTCRKSLTNIFT